MAGGLGEEEPWGCCTGGDLSGPWWAQTVPGFVHGGLRAEQAQPTISTCLPCSGLAFQWGFS